MAAIQRSKIEVVNKIKAVVVDITLLRADLRKVSDRVTTVDQNVDELQREFRSLRNMISDLQKLIARLDERIEDSEGRSRGNYLRFMGFPQKVEEHSPDLFLKE
ncbi:hypothetical protein NDU88_002044 [Pleurodeles waltl]|uniref:Uncharacterized protein n=1 Tax=Pleurodeles waltl TaxID=8319 RepID=A0AAV7T132_PLEWA|nr:hypothetical protein NDU88_002044 [Pleurodeles waltl]